MVERTSLLAIEQKHAVMNVNIQNVHRQAVEWFSCYKSFRPERVIYWFLYGVYSITKLTYHKSSSVVLILLASIVTLIDVDEYQTYTGSFYWTRKGRDQLIF